MRTELLDYPLPQERIAQRPAAERDAARLLVVEADATHDATVADWPSLVVPGSLVVLNDTRVRRARLVAHKPSGGKVELLLLHPAPAPQGVEQELARPGTEVWSVMAHANRPLSVGACLACAGAEFVALQRQADGTWLFAVRAPGGVEALCEQQGALPLPPYVARPADDDDGVRYQTVFARALGSAAAPTAGLHVSERVLAALAARGVEVGYLTLQVGAGTFLPVRCSDLNEHPMHSEEFSITPALRDQVVAARARAAPVIAVGTTVVRALESASDPAQPGCVRVCNESTRLLIQPGFRFGVVDGLLTNFHAPKSTLLALVSAFVDYERCLAAYRSALSRGYRFLSYGDAMWIPRRLSA
jgi:S-adenosylmethionine:tRNA ribosyltransferase-isomerase